jgi:hypothetical protein
VNEWLQLQRKRVQLDGVGAKLEAYAASLPYRASESWLAAGGGGSIAHWEILPRSFANWTSLAALGLAEYALHGAAAGCAATVADRKRHPEDTHDGNAETVAQFLVANGKPDQALAGIAARSQLPPVWKKAYTGLTGFICANILRWCATAFAGALGGDATIGERIAHPADRDEQLAGEVWFYYGSRYGEYLDEEKDAQAEGYLEAELEHTPESATPMRSLRSILRRPAGPSTRWPITNIRST